TGCRGRIPKIPIGKLPVSGVKPPLSIPKPPVSIPKPPPSISKPPVPGPKPIGPIPGEKGVVRIPPPSRKPEIPRVTRKEIPNPPKGLGSGPIPNQARTTGSQGGRRVFDAPGGAHAPRAVPGRLSLEDVHLFVLVDQLEANNSIRSAITELKAGHPL